MGDGFGFVAGGDDGGYGGPGGGRRSGGVVIVEEMDVPETSVGDEEVEPDGEQNYGDVLS